MKKTPSALKWLAEKRARVAHDLEQTARLATDLARRSEELRVDLAALDRSIQLYDANIDPASIGTVAAWKGRYGARGAMREAIEAVLQELAPEWVATDNLEMLVCARLGLSFETPLQRKRWYDDSFTSRLRKLAAEGLVERFHDPSVMTAEVGRWRWKQALAPSLSALQALAQPLDAVEAEADAAGSTVFRWLYIDPDLDERIKAESKATGRGTAKLFLDYVQAGLAAERAGAEPQRPASSKDVVLRSISMSIPSRLDAEVGGKALQNKLKRSEMYRAYVRLGLTRE